MRLRRGLLDLRKLVFVSYVIPSVYDVGCQWTTHHSKTNVALSTPVGLYYKEEAISQLEVSGGNVLPRIAPCNDFRCFDTKLYEKSSIKS